MSREDDYEESELIEKGPCPAPNCGSSDAFATYSDGHGYCFSCGHLSPADSDGSETPRRTQKAKPKELMDGQIGALGVRKLTEETCRLFNYRTGVFNGQRCHIANYTDWDGNPVAQKLRFSDKSSMPWLGDKKAASLFGSHRFGKGRRITITEGELDAMSVSQAQGNKWPAVSIMGGADSAKKDIAAALDYLANFDEIVLMFDMDDKGRAAVEEAAEVLTGHKVFVASLPRKDASECLQNGEGQEIVHAIYNAKPWAPANVVSGQSIIDRRRNRPKVTSYPFPDWLPKLNEKNRGIRLGELETWTSGSGMGKSTLMRQLQIHYFRTTQFNQALFMLEEPLEDTADELVSVWMEKRLKLPQVAATVPESAIHAAEEELFLAQDGEGNERIYIHDAFGNVGGDENLMNRIRYYAHAHNVKVFWLDHLSILVSDMGEDGDERRRIDALMHNLKALTVELGVYIGLVCHLKKAGGGTSFEEGAVPSLDDLRGSGGIKQLSNTVYALSRDQQAETETERNTAQVHSLKCRYTGETGGADFIFFDKFSAVFTAGIDPELIKGEHPEFDEYPEGYDPSENGPSDF